MFAVVGGYRSPHTSHSTTGAKNFNLLIVFFRLSCENRKIESRKRALPWVESHKFIKN